MENPGSVSLQPGPSPAANMQGPGADAVATSRGVPGGDAPLTEMRERGDDRPSKTDPETPNPPRLSWCHLVEDYGSVRSWPATSG